ncbi:DUF1566 domain-containing protein [Treponema primitia]|uniref:hypothetical protein n=1 Tax=Treponema primitia TaxID=88058 RepID=UPI0039817F8B
MKKLIVLVMAGALITLGSCAGNSVVSDGDVGTAQVTAAASGSDNDEPDRRALYAGDGGKGISLAILPPEGKGLAKDQDYLPAKVQGVFVRDMSNPYSAISVLNRLELERVIKEGESGVYTERADYIKLGEVTQTDYVMTGSITKTGSGYTLQMQIADTKDGITKAPYTGNCTLSELEDFSAINKAAAELLDKMGVNLTEVGKQALFADVDTRRMEAQTNLAKGIEAMKKGTVIEGLSLFIQSSSADPELSEAASRMNIVSRDISSGNIGVNARNEIAWRKDWTARLDECDQYVKNFLNNTPLPLNLLYSTELRHGEINWNRETLPISFDIRLFLATGENWPKPVTGVVDTVYEGLTATGKASSWNLSWPSSSSPIGNGAVRTYDVAVELVNDKKEVIGRETVRLSAGWETGFSNGKAYARKSETSRTVTFGAVNANKITDGLSIRVASLNGSNAETVAREKQISIADLDGYRLAKFGRTYQIGDTIPLRGLICYDGFQSPDYFEVVRFPGQYSWDQAVARLRATKVNGVGGWRMPSLEELNVISRLSESKGIFSVGIDRFNNETYWHELAEAYEKFGAAYAADANGPRTLYGTNSYWFSGGYKNFKDRSEVGSTDGQHILFAVRVIGTEAEERKLAEEWVELQQFINQPESWYQGAHKIGDRGPAGGFVFADQGANAPRGRRFLEAAPGETDFDARWNDAAKKCEELNVNGIRGWRLPTIDELNLMYRMVFSPGAPVAEAMSGFMRPVISGFIPSFYTYWSSSRTVVNFNHGRQSSENVRNRVRAVREF